MRVLIGFGMIGLTVLGFIAVVQYSRKVRDQGNGIMKRSMEWQRQLAAERQSEEENTDK